MTIAYKRPMKKILLIDDEDQFRSGAMIALKKQGYSVTDAADGFEGMQELIRSTTLGEVYDLIVLDIMMPKVSGTDILEFLIHKKIKTPVLVITGFMNYDLKCFCSRIKAIDILEKPFISADFYEKVKKMIGDDTGGTNEQAG
jgi:DNA-binding response OmpR family regulator